MKISSIFYGPINATSLPSFPSPFSFLKAKSKRAAVRSLSAGPSEPRFLFHPFAVQPREQVLSTLYIHSGQHGWCLQKPQSNRRDHQSHGHEPGANWSMDPCWGSTEKGGKLIILGVGEMDQRRDWGRHLSCALMFAWGAGGPHYQTYFLPQAPSICSSAIQKNYRGGPKKK